jgi:hypothetical protein
MNVPNWEVGVCPSLSDFHCELQVCYYYDLELISACRTFIDSQCVSFMCFFPTITASTHSAILAYSRQP